IQNLSGILQPTKSLFRNDCPHIYSILLRGLFVSLPACIAVKKHFHKNCCLTTTAVQDRLKQWCRSRLPGFLIHNPQSSARPYIPHNILCPWYKTKQD